MKLQVTIVTLTLAMLGGPASAQSGTAVNCTDPANAAAPECSGSNLPVPRLATNAAPLLIVPLALAGLAGAGGGGGGTPSTNGTTSTVSTGN